MGVAPWWKFFAADYLMDPDVDSLALDAQGILIRMWCVVWIEGEIPDDPAQIARKCRIDVLHVHMHLQTLRKFFTRTEHGMLISVRMEKERSKSSLLSAVRAKAAKLKHQKDVSAHADAKVHAKHGANEPAKTMHSDIRSQISESTKEKPSSADAEASMGDPRWRDFIDDWKRAFEHVTGKQFKPSTGDFAVLKKVLLENPNMDRETWRKCWNHWGKSLISHMKPFRFFGARIIEFEQGPLDKFFEPVTTATGKVSNDRSTAERKIDQIRETAARVEQRITGVPDGPPGGIPAADGRRGTGHVVGEPELLPPVRDQAGSGRHGPKSS